MVHIGEASNGLCRNTAKAVVLLWAKSLSEGGALCWGRLECGLLDKVSVRAPDKCGDLLLGQVEVGLSVVEDVVSDLYNVKVSFELYKGIEKLTSEAI